MNRRLMLLACVAAAAACPPPPPDDGDDAGPAPECEIDTSLDLDSTVPIEIGAPIDGFLCPQRDADFYAFAVAEDDSIVTVRLWMDTNLTATEPSWTLLAEDGAAVAESVSDTTRTAGEAPDVTASHRVDVAGAYVLRVADVEGLDTGFDVVNPYHLQVDVAPNPDANEPNDDAATAVVVAPGEVVGVIATTGDQDWYAVRVEAPGQVLDVRAQAAAESGVQHEIEVIGPDGVLVLDVQPFAPDPDDEDVVGARIRAPASGAQGTLYYVLVHDDDDVDAQLDADVGRYTLTVAVVADQDPQEAALRNDEPATATAATSGATFTAALATRGDQDLYRVAAPATTTRANPSVLLIEATMPALPEGLRPQVRVLGLDPEEDDEDLPGCGACGGDGVCLPYDGGRCGAARLQRFVDGATLRTAYALRDDRPVYVAVSDVGDDAFMESGTYTLTVTVVDDPDPGEAGDDYLIPNLESAGYANEGDLSDQLERSKPRARDLGAGDIPPACPSDEDTGAPEGLPDGGFVDGGAVDAPACLAIVPVPEQSGPQRAYTTACAGESDTFTLTGRISYEGDRDWFVFDVPAEGYWALDFTYDVSTTTPVELTFFVHTVESLIANDLVAAEVPGAPEPCSANATGDDADDACPDGSLCVDRRCWVEQTANAGFADAVFPAGDECAFVHVNDARADDGTRPIFVEVTDNGINDFDLEMQYTIDVRVRCGCPATCDGSFNECQGVAPPG